MAIQILYATDWKAVQRPDGSIYFTCGSSPGDYHTAFDVALDDMDLANRFCDALNRYNEAG